MMRRPAGFTLVELLAASAMAAMLTLAILHVTMTISSANKAMHAREVIDHWPPQAIEMIRRDLASAYAGFPGNNMFVIRSRAGVDPRTLEMTNRPVSIVYRIERNHDRTWLFRDQLPLDAPGAGVTTQCVMEGLDSMQLTIPELDGAKSGEDPLKGMRDRPLSTDAHLVLNRTGIPPLDLSILIWRESL